MFEDRESSIVTHDDLAIRRDHHGGSQEPIDRSPEIEHLILHDLARGPHGHDPAVAAIDLFAVRDVDDIVPRMRQAMSPRPVRVGDGVHDHAIAGDVELRDARLDNDVLRRRHGDVLDFTVHGDVRHGRGVVGVDGEDFPIPDAEDDETLAVDRHVVHVRRRAVSDADGFDVAPGGSADMDETRLGVAVDHLVVPQRRAVEDVALELIDERFVRGAVVDVRQVEFIGPEIANQDLAVQEPTRQERQRHRGSDLEAIAHAPRVLFRGDFTHTGRLLLKRGTAPRYLRDTLLLFLLLLVFGRQFSRMTLPPLPITPLMSRAQLILQSHFHVHVH